MKIITLYISTILLLSGCAKIDFENPATLTNQQAVDRIPDLGYKLTTSSIQNAFSATTGNNVLAIYADQITTTSNAGGVRYFAEEPRLEIVNNAAHRMHTPLLAIYTSFYQANLDATLALDIVENQGKIIYDVTGADRSNDSRIVAHFAKGLAQGYLGAVYDRGLIVDDLLATSDFPDSYEALIRNGLKHIDLAIQLVNQESNFKFDFIPGVSLDKTGFIRLANSLAARILASIPRDNAEAEALGADHWQKVLNYANAGIDADFIVTFATGGYYNTLLSSALARTSGIAGASWVDIKLSYLADKSPNPLNAHPYPTIPPPIESDDDRFDQYFAYSASLGSGQYPERAPVTASNYYRKRWYNTQNSLNRVGALNPYFLYEEIRLLRAEAFLGLGDLQAAANILNEPTGARKAKGKLQDNVATSKSDIIAAIHYEYAIEIDLAGGTLVPFTFMRRNDLLIGGTPTELPLPQSQLELIQKSVYSFGGIARVGELGEFGEVNTAKNQGWKLSE
ncbi:hypothetical protein [Sphingobacterium sp. LRF_L2]|uniref:hypothetical protein n=1 Tax=Sphingobacterium sp. LRF_L2 TaxID=3369421 RepID=UPI003F605987